MSGPGDEALARLARRVLALLGPNHGRLVTAESCTGGYIAKCLTDVAGSSAVYERGFVTYSNEAKHQQLGVPRRLLHAHGAVSEPVARAMASGAVAVPGATHAIAVTGIAGPGGATPGKPVGMVWIAWARPGARRGKVILRSRGYRFRGDRDTIRRRAVAAALKGLLEP